ncbi:branched-chain amino acid ABC transporter permease [Halofilum ochraceum]|uniref:branched-chain amino acid ABC transporter permease n=1 Tax=Halofilum ochraceum TaxID=1611323 RepID=UPI0009471860|nr:branched-chain amino acid ABC transporter permease [Halofilum ochraceum]
MSDVIGLAISALNLGSLYALMALGLVLVYGILRLVNFAYGDLVMVVGYALYLMRETAMPWLVMAVIAVMAAMLVSVLTERIAFRPVRDKSLTAMLVTSFAVSMLLQTGAQLFISPRSRVVPMPDMFTTTVEIAGNMIALRELIAIAVSILMLVLFTVLLNRTVLGIALRAAADNFRMTRMLGIPANMVISAAFAISGFLAGVVALFWLGRGGSVTPDIGLQPLIVAFVATVLGGMHSLLGAVVGGYALGIITVVINTFMPEALTGYRQAFIFALVIVILIARPEGLVRSK